MNKTSRGVNAALVLDDDNMKGAVSNLTKNLSSGSAGYTLTSTAADTSKGDIKGVVVQGSKSIIGSGSDISQLSLNENSSRGLSEGLQSAAKDSTGGLLNSAVQGSVDDVNGAESNTARISITGENTNYAGNHVVVGYPVTSGHPVGGLLGNLLNSAVGTADNVLGNIFHGLVKRSISDANDDIIDNSIGVSDLKDDNKDNISNNNVIDNYNNHSNDINSVGSDIGIENKNDNYDADENNDTTDMDNSFRHI